MRAKKLQSQIRNLDIYKKNEISLFFSNTTSSNQIEFNNFVNRLTIGTQDPIDSDHKIDLSAIAITHLNSNNQPNVQSFLSQLDSSAFSLSETISNIQLQTISPDVFFYNSSTDTNDISGLSLWKLILDRNDISGSGISDDLNQTTAFTNTKKNLIETTDSSMNLFASRLLSIENSFESQKEQINLFREQIQTINGYPFFYD